MRLLLFQLWESFAHLSHQRGNDLVKRPALGAQLVTVAARTRRMMRRST